jgi:hypothetical protein
MFSNKREERLMKGHVLIGVIHNHLVILVEDWELWSFKTQKQIIEHKLMIREQAFH